MDHLVFVPVSDELLFDHPERIRGPLVPYMPGMTVDNRARAETSGSTIESAAAEQRQTHRVKRRAGG